MPQPSGQGGPGEPSEPKRPPAQIGPGGTAPAVSRDDVIAALDEIATLLELGGENDFKTQAYRRALRALEAGGWDPVAAAVDGTLADHKGFGPALVEKIATLVTTGSLPYLDELRRSFPKTLTDLLAVRGLGAKRLGRLHRELGITDAESLRRACEDGRLAALKGFGAASARRLVDGLDYISLNAGRWLLPDALGGSQAILLALSRDKLHANLTIAGEVARGAETVTSLRLLAIAPEQASPAETLDRLAADIRAAGIAPAVSLDHEALRLTFRAPADMPVTLVVAPIRQEGTRRVLETSSPEHSAALAQRARRLGLDLRSDGLYRDGVVLEPADETEFYRLLDLPFLAPELREDGVALERAIDGRLSPLVEPTDLRGFLHVHTTASDGKNTLEEMAKAIAQRGGTYFGVCDHSQASHWAGGLSPAEVSDQHAAIDAWNAAGRSPFILKGIEADILPDGRIDYDEATLASFDFVVASVHINFQMTKEEMTRRVLRALDNPLVDILAHPTGRLLLERPGYAIDLDAVAARAAERDVILEINANPHRLDLAWDRARAFRTGGLRFSINTDAHTVDGLRNDVYGVCVARRAGIGPGEILNTLPLEVLRERFRQRRNRAGIRKDH